MTAIIELEDLSKHYSSVIVGVDQVSLSVEDGEFVTLLGPSGCGKSTLLRMIGGFERPTRGTIRLAKRDVTFEPPHRREVNMVFQDYALFPHMTVGENIAYGLKMMGLGRSERDHRVLEALNLVGLPEKIDQRPHQLSGGQRQRVALARAIVRRPKVLLLDEPLSALDAKMREQMQLELKHLHQKVGITFIMVTHDQTEALVMSDRVVVMENGRVAQDGRPQDLYDHPATPYVANFIGTTNFLSGQVMGHDSQAIAVEVAGSKLTIPLESPLPNGSRVTVGFRPSKVRVLMNGEDVGEPANILTGRIAEVIYYGLGLRTAIELDGGSRIFADSLLNDSLARSPVPQVGAPVRMHVACHNIYLFDGESEL